tara:strand:- start:676 stop:918 length:243 start_codon:yes stop_codon:yes gene_type:complete
MDMRTESGRILWPMIEEILGKVDRREVTPQAMISALMFTAIFLAFAIGLDRKKFLHMVLAKWAEMELAEGKAVWGVIGEA